MMNIRTRFDVGAKVVFTPYGREEPVTGRVDGITIYVACNCRQETMVRIDYYVEFEGDYVSNIKQHERVREMDLAPWRA